MNSGSDIEAIINPMGVGLSAGGRRRLDALSGLIMSVCHQNSALVSVQGGIHGVIAGFVHGLECNPVKVEMSSYRISCDDDKTELISSIDERMDMQAYDAVFMCCEAWSSSATGRSAPIRPSLDPNREEVIFTQFVVNINFQPYIIMVKQQIIRDGFDVHLGDPDFAICDSSQAMGAMSSFRSQTCPIT